MGCETDNVNNNESSQEIRWIQIESWRLKKNSRQKLDFHNYVGLVDMFRICPIKYLSAV